MDTCYLNGKEIITTFQTKRQKFRIEKVIKRKGNKLYGKWKGNDNLFNSRIDKNVI